MTEPQSPLLPESTPDPAAPPAFATLVADDGRLVRLRHDAGGALVLEVERRREGGPLRFDRFQAAAFRAAVAAMAEG